mgnify:CR=1 FL=1
MNADRMNIVILGLTMSSSWGNGHATTYRALVRELCAAGHRVLFLERDVPWYADHRDMPHPSFCELELYSNLEQLKTVYRETIRQADMVIVGSYVPDGIAVGEWVAETAEGVKAFYDIDTPITLTALERGDCAYLAPRLIPRFDLYLSFTGGPTLRQLETEYGAPKARPLYCSVDPELYFPQDLPQSFDLGYMGTYSTDRQPVLEQLLMEPARRNAELQFIVAGPLYPATIEWPNNVVHFDHLPPREHCAFYNSQRFTLNVTRADMVRAGYSPSVRLFEAAACGTPIISDDWEGLDTFFIPDEEILICHSPEDVSDILVNMKDDQRRAIGERARARVLTAHTARHRADELIAYAREARAIHTMQ